MKRTRKTKTKILVRVPMARVEKDVRDGRRDYYIPKSEAKKLYEEGKLHIDITNSINEIVYIEPE
jgi:hypothetical protein